MMPYQLVYHNPMFPEPEELEVKQALRDYEIDPERMDMFVPTRALYDTYRHFVDGITQHRVADTLRLNQFGFALRIMFEDYFYTMADMGEEMPCRRRINGKKVRGLCGWIGPETREVKLAPGRPHTR